jgi:hypothetical protein
MRRRKPGNDKQRRWVNAQSDREYSAIHDFISVSFFIYSCGFSAMNAAHLRLRCIGHP